MNGATRYACGAGDDQRHPRPKSVSEGEIIAWVQEEVARLQVPERVASDHMAADADGQHDLAERLGKLSRQHEMGVIDDGQLAERAGPVLDALGAPDTHERALDAPPAIDWATHPPEVVNGALRAIWEYVELGSNLRPVRAAWRVARFRA